MSSTTTTQTTTNFKPTDVHLFGIVFAVLTFWLFGQTFLNLGPIIGSDLSMGSGAINFAVSLGALVSGMFIVMLGSLGDRIGRVRLLITGSVFNIIGALLVAFAFGSESVASIMVLVGRALMGLSTGAITPTGLALVNTYWEGDARSRAVSMVSIGSFGGLALSSYFGGFLAESPLGWRSIFIISAVLSVLSILMVRGIPESAPNKNDAGHLDWGGAISLATAMIALQLVITQGANWGWTSPIILGLIALLILAIVYFVRHEKKIENPLVDFAVFKNRAYSGVVISNFFLTGTIGMISISMWVLQGAGDLLPDEAGNVTLGYAICLILFIRAGEKMMQKIGTKIPLLLGAFLVLTATLLLSTTNLMQETYEILAIIAFCCYGLGLAFFATPATATALAALPPHMVGAGSGVLKMTTSLGSAIGIAVGTSIFTALEGTGSEFIGAAVEYVGRVDNLAVRQAGQVSLLVLAMFAVISIIMIIVTIPSRKKEQAAQQ